MDRKSVKHPRRERHGLDDLLRNNPNLLRTLLVTAFLAALTVRLLIDPHMPYHYDVGKNMVYSLAAADAFPLLPQWNPYFNLGEYYEYQVGFPYLVGALHAVTGVSVVTLGQVVILLAGSALTFTMYLLVQELTGRRDAAVIAAFMVAASGMQVYTYINYYPQILATAIFPLALLYLVRYYRDGDITHLLLSGVVCAAVTLTSYIAGMVLVLLIVLAVVVQGLRERSARSWLPLPVTLAMVALVGAPHWLPILGRYGMDMIQTYLVSSMLGHSFEFFHTYGADLTVEFAFLVSTAVIAIIVLAFFIIQTFHRPPGKETKRNGNKLGFPSILTACMVVLPLLLFASIWVHPLLFPGRYLPFMDLGIIVVAATVMALGVEKASRRWGRKTFSLLLLLGLLFIFPFATGWHFASVDIPLNLQSYPEVEELVPEGALVAAPGGVQSAWLSAETGVLMLGGESAKLMGAHFQGWAASDTIMDNTTVEGKMDVIRQYGVNYVYVPLNYYYPGRLVHSFTMEALEPFDNETCFEVAYFAEDPVDGYVFLFRVREDLTPQYHQPEYDVPLTAASYGLALTTMAFAFAALALQKWRDLSLSPPDYRIPLLAAISIIVAYALLCVFL